MYKIKLNLVVFLRQNQNGGLVVDLLGGPLIGGHILYRDLDENLTVNPKMESVLTFLFPLI